MSDEAKLLPCPFCGAETEIERNMFRYFIKCSNPSCEAFVQTADCENSEEAVRIGIPAQSYE